MHCTNCGRPLGPGEKYCVECGAPVTQAPPVPPPPPVGVPPGIPAVMPAVMPPAGPAAKKPFTKTPAFIVLLTVIGLLVIAGIVLGLVFGLSGGNEQAKKDAEKYSTEAVDKLNSAKKTLEGTSSEFDSIDFSSVDQAAKLVDKIKLELEKAQSDLNAAEESVRKIDTEKLPEWWKEYVSLLNESAKEGKAGIKDLDALLGKAMNASTFGAHVNSGVNTFEQFINTMNQALDQLNSGQYPAAKNTAGSATTYLTQAGDSFNKAKQLEPGADLSKFINNIAVAQNLIPTLQNACDAAIAGNAAQYNTLISQFNSDKNQVNLDMVFDSEAYFGTEIEKLRASMASNFEKADKDLKDAEALKEKNAKT